MVPPEKVRGVRGGAAGPLFQELERFWARLRDDLLMLQATLERLIRLADEHELAVAGAAHAVDSALVDLEGLGTLWSLELEMTRRRHPQLSGTVGSRFREFAEAMGRLRESARASSDTAMAIARLREETAKLLETVAAWLQDGLEATEEGNPPHR